MNSFLMAVIGGGLGFAVLAAAVLTGLRVIKVKVKVHKAIGLTVLAFGFVHGLAGLLLYLGII